MRARAAVVLALLAAVAFISSPAIAGRTLIAAHRGGAALRAENSLGAFRNALALGVDALEFDLHMTRDGDVVVIHDPTLDRTTTLTGPVRDRTLAELRAAKVKTANGEITDEAVPSFAELLELARSSGVEILPEIKVGPGGAPYAGIEEKVLTLLRTHGMLERATIQAFQPATIARIRTLEPRARTMSLVRAAIAPELVMEALARARALGATDVGLNHRLVDEGVVAATRSAKLRLSVWTVNDEADIKRMLALGVDVIMSDRPDLVKQLAGR